MSPVRSTARNRALNVAMIVGCASGVQLAGCLNSPFRSDITKETGRVSQQVELASAREAEMDRLLDTNQVEFAGGIQPESTSAVVHVNGEEVPAKRSRWMFWKKNPSAATESNDAEKIQDKSEKIQDKIEKSDSLASRPNALTENKSSTSRALAAEPAPSAKPIKDLSPENWFEKEFAASGARISAERSKAASDAAVDGELKDASPSATPKAPVTASATPSAAKGAASLQAKSTADNAAAPDKAAFENVATDKAAPAVAATAKSPFTESQPAAQDTWAQRPFPGMAAAKPAEKPQAVPSTDFGNAPSVSKAVTSESPFGSPSWMSATPRSTPSKTSVDPFAETTTGLAAGATTGGAEKTSAKADPFSQGTPAKENVGTAFVASTDRFEPSPTDDVSQRQQRLRVRALMSQAHSSEIRGELHSAYRSALLAEKIATESRLAFSSEDENPSEFARMISARIFKSNPSSQLANAPQGTLENSGEIATKPAPEAMVFTAATQVAQTQAPQPEKRVADQASSPFDSPFNERFATWVAAPTTPAVAKKAESSAMAPSPFGEVASTPTTTTSRFKATTIESSDALPEIRPGMPSGSGSREALTASAGDTWSAFPASAATPTLTQTSATPSGFDSKGMGVAASGMSDNVQFALGESTRSVNEPRPFQGFGDSTQSRMLPDQGMASATIGRHRPMLEAPPVPAPPLEFVQNQSSLQFDDPLAESSVEELEPAKTASNRTLWIVVGLLGAGVATVFGLKKSRERDEETSEDAPSLELPVAQSEPLVADENVQFKIKRAA
ncbi:hypothetical protein [Planctomicrobium sp. SH527]|uniref:hypothetical protein n=1 Tax=Planctomicrobium sp. SH527 TaxID=3448123 RepID=UPI003F5C5E26